MHQTSLFPRAIQKLAPGVIHVHDWLSLEEQQQLLEQCREWAKPPAGLSTTPKMLDGKALSIRVLCLGWHWYPYLYSKKHRYFLFQQIGFGSVDNFSRCDRIMSSKASRISNFLFYRVLGYLEDSLLALRIAMFNFGVIPQ